MKSGTVKESISRQLFDEETVLQNNDNITMQSENQQQHGGDMNNDVSNKNDNNDTSNTTQHNEQEPMESQQDDGLDSNEPTSTLMGRDDNMNQQEEQQHQQEEDSSSSESEEESSSSTSSEESDESDNDEGLSEYELLRKRNIKRNQKRLRKLGLLTDNNTSALSAAASKSNGGESSNTPKQVRKQQSKAPIQRRSLPRRKCAKLSLLLSNNNENSTSNDMNNNKTNGYESDESSIAPSPIQITRILHPQPHQKKSLEQQEDHLKQYKRTRRMKRGRPKREEYEYVCNESCKVCGGSWVLDDSSNENVEEETRLIRCKDCRGAFHLKCMLAMGDHNSVDEGGSGDEGGSEDNNNKNEDEEEEDRKMPAAASYDNNADDNGMSLEVVQETRDPKRCYKCEEEYKRRKEHEQQRTSSATQTSLPILEATLSNNQTVRVRITPEPLLEANVNGKDVSVSVVLNSGDINGSSSNNGNDNTKKSSKEATNGLTCPHCSKEFVSQGGLDYHVEKKVCQKKKHVTWGTPLEEKEDGNDDDDDDDDDDPTTKKIRKIINKALADTDYAKLQDYSCAALRKHIPKDADKVMRLGGIQMLTTAMEHHPQRPMIQAEALCTLSELAWTLPQSSVDICRGCLDLLVAAMEHHSSHAKVLEMGCGLLRALSYDADCCVQLKKTKAVSVVVESIKHNPRKVDVMIEGSMFLQNMMVVSANTTLTSILGTTKRCRQMNDDDNEQVDLLSTLVTAIRTHSDNADLAFAVFGLLSNIAIHDEGSASLSGGFDVHTLATEAIRIHSSHSDLHDVVSSLLQNVEQATSG